MEMYNILTIHDNGLKFKHDLDMWLPEFKNDLVLASQFEDEVSTTNDITMDDANDTLLSVDQELQKEINAYYSNTIN